MKIIMDCDTGADDAIALLLAFQAKDTVDMLAVTCVNGNCSLDKATRNTLITLKIAGHSVCYCLVEFITSILLFSNAP